MKWSLEAVNKFPIVAIPILLKLSDTDTDTDNFIFSRNST